MERLVEIVGGRLRRQVRPELIEEPIAVQAAAGQGEKLDQVPDLPPPPVLRLDRSIADGDAKAPEQAHL
jgi:hypothetical protein